jgi:hypothetical protein
MTATLINRASLSRPPANGDDDYDMLENGVVAFFLDAAGPQDRPLDVRERPQRRHPPGGASIRAEAGGCDGCRVCAQARM